MVVRIKEQASPAHHTLSFRFIIQSLTHTDNDSSLAISLSAADFLHPRRQAPAFQLTQLSPGFARSCHSIAARQPQRVTLSVRGREGEGERGRGGEREREAGGRSGYSLLPSLTSNRKAHTSRAD